MFIKIMEQTFLDNSLLSYVMALLVFLLGLIFIKVFAGIVVKKAKKWAQKTATTVDDFLVEVIEKVLIPLSSLGIFYVSINMLTFNDFLGRIIQVLSLAILTVFAVRFVILALGYGFKVYSAKREADVSLERSLDGILKVAKIIIWGLAIVFFLDNLGFKISAVLAGLGIGGIAVALAAQAVLKDVFSYFCIIFDRPFAAGDFIIIGEYLGTVEHIGIKTTRIRSLSGEQVVFSNTDLTDSRVRNYKRMDKRRVAFRFGVTYQTKVEQLRELPGIVKEIIENAGDTTFDRAHFFSFGDFSLIFEVVYYVTGSDYNKYMDVQQQINLKLKEELEERKIEFAYPTQMVYLAK
ncbi:MAG: mechanosensitive ion channel family protein [Candidatus Omnitrophota bacterium]